VMYSTVTPNKSRLLRTRLSEQDCSSAFWDRGRGRAEEREENARTKWISY